VRRSLQRRAQLTGEATARTRAAIRLVGLFDRSSCPFIVVEAASVAVSPRVVRTSSLTPSRSELCTNFEIAGCPNARRRPPENDRYQPRARMPPSPSDHARAPQNKSPAWNGATPIYGVAMLSERAKPEDRGNRRLRAVNIRSTVRADEELLASTDCSVPCSSAHQESRRRRPQAKIRGTRASSGLFRAGIIDSPRGATQSLARCRLLFSLRLDRTMKFTACAVEDTT